MTTPPSDSSTSPRVDTNAMTTTVPDSSTNLPNDTESEKSLSETTLSTDLSNLQLSPTAKVPDNDTTDNAPIVDKPPSVKSDVSDEEYEHDWSSGESYDSRSYHHHMSRREIRLYEEKRALEKQEPIQAHLENLHRAFWSVDPDYTIFAFGGTISRDQVDAGKLALRVWKSTLDTCDTVGVAGDEEKDGDAEREGDTKVGGGGAADKSPRMPEALAFADRSASRTISRIFSSVTSSLSLITTFLPVSIAFCDSPR
jgi:hypothetical protein